MYVLHFKMVISDVKTVQEHLIQQFEGATHNVQSIPLHKDAGFQQPEMYGSLLEEEDLKSLGSTREWCEFICRDIFDNLKDIFYIEDKLAKRIFLTGEAGLGKTVLCLNLIKSWSEAKKSLGQIDGKQKDIDKQTEAAQGANDNRWVLPKKEIQGPGLESENDKGLDGTTKRRSLLDRLRGPQRGIELKHIGENKQLQRFLSLFDLVYFVPLRHSKHGISTIADLICDSISEHDQSAKRKIKRMLGDGNIKCLVFLDGLDEYKLPDTCKVKGIPDSDGLVNCTIVCTVRPWKIINEQLGLNNTCDKVVRVRGLPDTSVETVIRDVLVHFNGLEISSPLYKKRFKQFCVRAKLKDVKSLIKSPLMLQASCLVWNDESDRESVVFHDKNENCQIDSDLGTTRHTVSYGDEGSNYLENTEDTSYFMTLFFVKLTSMTITQAEKKHVIVKTLLCEGRQNRDPSIELLSILSEFDIIIDSFAFLKPVGRAALQDLLSDEPHLVFSKNKLEKEIGQSVVELALKAGILCESKAPGVHYQRRVSLSFYHKFIQEFIAALYLTCGDTEVLSSFCTNVKSVDKVMELSNMIKFVFGLDPIVGSQFSEHVKDIVSSDIDIIKYKEYKESCFKEMKDSAGNINLGQWKSKNLYKNQCKWFTEMEHNMSYTHNTEHTPILHAIDVCLDPVNDRDEVNVASGLTSAERNSIVSVHLDRVEHPIFSIVQHLPSCKHLTSLYIEHIQDKENIKLLASVLPNLAQLQHVKFSEYQWKMHELDWTVVVRATGKLHTLKSIKLSNISLTDAVALPPLVEEIVLWEVTAAHFILSSLRRCSRLKYIKVTGTELTETVRLPPMLEKVELSAVHSSHFILQSLCQCSQLKYIYLSFIELTDTLTQWCSHMLESVVLNHVTHAHYFLRLLPRLPYLTSLEISRDCSDDDKVLARVLPQLVHLRHIRYEGRIKTDTGDVSVVGALRHLTQLRGIQLYEIDMKDDGALLVTPNMTQLEKVELSRVKMSARSWAEFFCSLQHATQLTHLYLRGSDLGDDGTLLVRAEMAQLKKMDIRTIKMSARGWMEFVSSLHSVQHAICVLLVRTNIDNETVDTIHNSPKYFVTKTNVEGNDWVSMTFYTVM